VPLMVSGRTLILRDRELSVIDVYSFFVPALVLCITVLGQTHDLMKFHQFIFHFVYL
jgi:hypothetical protein